MPKPIILLAFANERQEETAYLRNLPLEANGLIDILKLARERGLCDYEVIYNATLDRLIAGFQEGGELIVRKDTLRQIAASSPDYDIFGHG